MLEQSQSGQRPSLMVAREYAPLLEGVSYCDCVPFDGDFNELDRAMEYAKTLAHEVKCLQVAGPPDPVKRHTYEAHSEPKAITGSFVQEVYRLAGKLDRWKDQPELRFDSRSPEREAVLCADLPKPVGPPRNRKKIVLVHLGGISSPFPYADLCWELLRLKFPKYHFVDLSEVKAERFYDLLGLFERAHCLVASDSAPLHLAFACRNTLPVVALVNDKPSLWHGAPWRANHIAHIRYSDFPHRATEMLNAIECIGGVGCPFNPSLESQRVIHVWSQYEITHENQQRTLKAADSWEQAFPDRLVSTFVEMGAVGQDTASILKDEKRYPLVKDVIRMGCMRAKSDDDVICLTRCDTAIECNTAIEVSTAITAVKLPAYAHRTIRTDEGNTYHPAVDLFVFTRKWWNEHAKEFPPMVMGTDTLWYRVLLDLFKKHGAKELPFAVYRSAGAPLAALPVTPKRVIHNEGLAKDFWAANPSQLEPSPVTKQTAEGWTVNRHALFPYGYNPSLIRFEGRLLMAYRWHPEHETQTRLAVAEFDDGFNVKNNREVRVQARSAEDPRLFIHKDSLWVSFVDSTWPETNPKCITKYGRLREYQDHWVIEDIYQPMIGKNDGSSLEKNWCFWEHAGQLNCLYQTSPERITYILKGEQVISEHKAPGMRWPWGPIRGGSQPFKFKDGWLRFFHSGLDNEPSPWRRRYYMGAMTLTEPGGIVTDISKDPILRGSEHDELNQMERNGCQQYKAKVVFPCGAIEHEGGFLLSVGVNDSHCALVKVTEKELKL